METEESSENKPFFLCPKKTRIKIGAPLLIYLGQGVPIFVFAFFGNQFFRNPAGLTSEILQLRLGQASTIVFPLYIITASSSILGLWCIVGYISRVCLISPSAEKHTPVIPTTIFHFLCLKTAYLVQQRLLNVLAAARSEL